MHSQSEVDPSCHCAGLLGMHCDTTIHMYKRCLRCYARDIGILCTQCHFAAHVRVKLLSDCLLR